MYTQIVSGVLQETNQHLRKPDELKFGSSILRMGDRRKEEMALHLHIKNRKKFTHLYQLEKYFR